MHADRIDLSAIDPRADELRWERMVGDVLRAGGVAPAAPRPTPVLQLLRWTRPVLAAAAAVAALALPGLAGGTPDAPPRSAASPLARALGMPAPVARWVQAERTTETDRMVLATLGAAR